MANRSINKVTLLGNLTRDPELKYLPTGSAVCTFGVATNRSWTTNEGQLKEEVQYHRITAWNKLAELCGKILAKGKKVYLEGRITYRSYTGKDGVQRSITEIILDDFIVLSSAGGKPGSYEGGEGEQHGEAHQEGADAPEPAGDEQKASKAPAPADESINPDDIPF